MFFTDDSCSNYYSDLLLLPSADEVDAATTAVCGNCADRLSDFMEYLIICQAGDFIDFPVCNYVLRSCICTYIHIWYYAAFSYKVTNNI